MIIVMMVMIMMMIMMIIMMVMMMIMMMVMIIMMVMMIVMIMMMVIVMLIVGICINYSCTYKCAALIIRQEWTVGGDTSSSGRDPLLSVDGNRGRTINGDKSFRALGLPFSCRPNSFCIDTADFRLKLGPWQKIDCIRTFLIPAGA